MSCGTKTLKISSFVLDFLCCVLAALTIAACAYALIAFSHSMAIRVPCIVAIVLGSLLFGSTIFGCVAALKESIRLTWIYAAILLALVFGQITVIFAQPINFELLANETIHSAWQGQLYRQGGMSYYEIKYHCCGMSGPSNYPDSGLRIPQSCYFNQNTTVTTDLYTVGCDRQLAAAFAKGTRWERIGDWSVVGVEMLSVMVAGLLAITLQNAERRRPYR
ncbi:protein late bloomer [Drosophila guanche]|uniref:Blast:Protein late bloomer n=1 Tax=Drosophila guanche TaxID=7266 RepID=A0A3B0JI60_DROGU|nr:protein late bloomer [Drosophila guanche]SPP73089.1 blast:Protein late bloomer [Drosophila guanche]